MLNGAIVNVPDSIFSLQNWWNGSYQEQHEKYLNENFGFRNLFIRINNQIAYSLFNKCKANGVIIGRDNYLFEENYLKAYAGLDYIGDDSINKRFQKLKFISDTLGKLNKKIVLLFAAGKGTYYSEYMPEQYLTKIGTTNFESHLSKAKAFGINHIDFNTYFLNNKSKMPYKLYPKYGIHWSKYGMHLATDSIIKYTERLLSIDMNNIVNDGFEQNPDLVYDNSDADIRKGINILMSYHEDSLGYPKIKFEQDAAKVKPKAIFISDSFFWGIFNFGICQSVFSDSHFWYYNNEIYPESLTSPLSTKDIDYKAELLKHDVVYILATEATLPKFSWGFIDRAYELFSSNQSNPILSKEINEKIKNLINYIRTDEKWFASIKQYAMDKKVSIDSALFVNAKWVIENPGK